MNNEKNIVFYAIFFSFNRHRVHSIIVLNNTFFTKVKTLSLL